MLVFFINYFLFIPLPWCFGVSVVLLWAYVCFSSFACACVVCLCLRVCLCVCVCVCLGVFKPMSWAAHGESQEGNLGDP